MSIMGGGLVQEREGGKKIRKRVRKGGEITLSVTQLNSCYSVETGKQR